MINNIIKKSKEIHNNKYNYSLVEYKNMKTKVKIICPIHGIFKQTFNNHVYKKNGCPLCGGTNKLTSEIFIKKSKEKHDNKYDYSLVEYKNMKTKVKIICPEHGIFEQEPKHHVNGSGCPYCYGFNKNTMFFIKQSKEIHGNKYDYSLVNYINSQIPVIIICSIHGEFKQSPNNHLSKKYGCPMCNESKGEREIRNILNKNNIKFESQKTFNGLKYKQKLHFDFYLPDYKICIEYDGIQHFEPVNIFGGENKFNILKIKDNIKDNYCYNNNIKLIRIKYDKYDLIKEIISNLFFIYNIN